MDALLLLYTMNIEYVLQCCNQSSSSLSAAPKCHSSASGLAITDTPIIEPTEHTLLTI